MKFWCISMLLAITLLLFNVYAHASEFAELKRQQSEVELQEVVDKNYSHIVIVHEMPQPEVVHNLDGARKNVHNYPWRGLVLGVHGWGMIVAFTPFLASMPSIPVDLDQLHSIVSLTAGLQFGVFSVLLPLTIDYYDYCVYRAPSRGALKEKIEALGILPSSLVPIVTGYLRARQLSLAADMKIAGLRCMMVGLPPAMSAISWKRSLDMISYARSNYSEILTFHPYDSNMLAIEQCCFRSKIACLAGTALSGLGALLWSAGKITECFSRCRSYRRARNH